MPLRLLRRLGCLGGLLFGLVVAVLVAVVLAPWSLHIGGRWTPMSWWGYGKLQTDSGDQYPMFIYIAPKFRSVSHLRLNGKRPTSGLIGTAWLCSAQGVTQRLAVSGDIYDTYLNADGSQLSIRLLDAKNYFRINAQSRRYADFLGAWQGSDLTLHDNGSWERNFHPESRNSSTRASVTFNWGSYSNFKNLCNSTAIPPKAQIGPPRN